MPRSKTTNRKTCVENKRKIVQNYGRRRNQESPLVFKRVRETTSVVSTCTASTSTVSTSTISTSTGRALRVRRGIRSGGGRAVFVRVVRVAVAGRHGELGVTRRQAACKSGFQHSRSGRGNISLGRKQRGSGQISGSLEVRLFIGHR